MPRNLIDLAYLTASPFVAASMYRKYKKTGKYADSAPGMLARNIPSHRLPKKTRCWMHSVSVGESVAASAFYKRLKVERPKWEYLATTTTETGQEQARKSLEGADYFAYAPFDYRPFLEKFHRYYRPSLYCFFETEIWPNHLLYLKKRKIPTFLINGKLSGKSARRYAQFGFLFKPVLSGVTRFFMQSERDAERMERIIGSSKRIEVVGNIKFDALPEPMKKDEKQQLRKSWSIQDDEFLIFAGSTHQGEEDSIIEAFLQARKEVPNLRLAIAPRHPERFDRVADTIMEYDLTVTRTSKQGVGTHIKNLDDQPVILLDQMGVLARYFGAGDLALVGGSWNPVGGHNLLEPAIHGIPVIRGPHMESQPEIVRVLSPKKGGLNIPEHRLGKAFIELAQNPERCKVIGKKAKRAAESSKGSAKRVVDLMLEDLSARK